MSRTSPQMPAKLAESAFELFGQRGFSDVTIDEIAAHAGVTKGSFYSHYQAKHEIILAACSYYYRYYQQRVHAELAPLSDPLKRLRRVLEFSVHTCVVDDQSRVFTTEVFALSLQDDDVRKGWSQFYDTVREMYVGLVLAAQAAGEIDVADPRRAVDMMLAAIEGVKMRAAFESRMSEPAEQQAIVEDLLRIVSSGPSSGGGLSGSETV